MMLLQIRICGKVYNLIAICLDGEKEQDDINLDEEKEQDEAEIVELKIVAANKPSRAKKKSK